MAMQGADIIFLQNLFWIYGSQMRKVAEEYPDVNLNMRLVTKVTTQILQTMAYVCTQDMYKALLQV